jgi:hypothetical protein
VLVSGHYAVGRERVPGVGHNRKRAGEKNKKSQANAFHTPDLSHRLVTKPDIGVPWSHDPPARDPAVVFIRTGSTDEMSHDRTCVCTVHISRPEA